MQTQTGRRVFSGINKSIAVMANGEQADLAAARVMNKLSEVSGVNDFEYFGYGGANMLKSGLWESEIDANQITDKTFYTYRKTRLHDRSYFHRYSPLNLVNKHFSWSTKDTFDLLQQRNFFERAYKSRPSVMITFDNEYLLFKVMNQMTDYYRGNSVEQPWRHFYGRFVKDMQQYNLEDFDFMHYTVPLFTAKPDGFRFPSKFVGQYGVYDALRHLLIKDGEFSKHLVHDNSVLINKNDFASHMQEVNSRRRDAYKA